MLTLLAQAVPADQANPLPALWRILTKMAYFAGLITTLGGSALYLLVLRPVLRRPSVDPRDRTTLFGRAGLLLAIAGTWYLIALYFQLAGKAARVKGTEIPYGQALNPAAIWRYVSVPAKKGEWISTGAQTLAQYVLWAASAIVLMVLWSPRFRARLTGVVASALVLSFVAYQVTLLPTDFRKETGPDFVDGLLDHTHVTAVSTWIGGIAGLVALSFTVRRQLTPGAGTTWAQLWTRFGTVALCAVGCLLISGLYLAWTFVGSPSELLTTAFGRFLLVKVSLVACMIAVGGLNEFVLMPRMARARAAGDSSSVFRLALRVFPSLVLVEVVLAVGVLFVLSFLTGSARVEAGDPDPTLSGSIIGTGALLAVLLAVSFVTTAKVSERLSRPAAVEAPVAVEQS
ncbi:copper resistance D family protein [Kutzneria sp. CA-103260]|uniref:copper resistance D family protein n=1 Tax=Kutzneria sp. CA-103260 TaxID=2802641 RepID=UPI001BA5277E|nr:CopD family protein [Kutzneria sp. CA-103260]QUQ72461.1 Copper resistance protein D [Kutzneria sp. CA-103260]